MAQTCQCPAFGFCPARNAKTTTSSWRLCQDGKLDAMIEAANQSSRFTSAPVSSVGTQLLKTLKAEIKKQIPCQSCRNYINSLNYITEHDHDAIVDRLYAEFPWPQTWREKHPDNRARISELLHPIVPKPEPPTDPANLHFAGRCVAVTSLNPNPLRWARQFKCLESWRQYGLPTVTVNTWEELSQLPLPEYVTPVVCNKITDTYDRQTQLVTSLVKAGIQTNLPFMLINSDIEIRGPRQLLELALTKPKLTIGIRYNHAPSSPYGMSHRETAGLDVFMMTPEMAATIPDAPFGIGKPVWDYWLPAHFRNQGVKFHWIRRRLFFHENHELGWTPHEWHIGKNYLSAMYGIELGYGSMEFRESLNKDGPPYGKSPTV